MIPLSLSLTRSPISLSLFLSLYLPPAREESLASGGYSLLALPPSSSLSILLLIPTPESPLASGRAATLQWRDDRWCGAVCTRIGPRSMTD